MQPLGWREALTVHDGIGRNPRRWRRCPRSGRAYHCGWAKLDPGSGRNSFVRIGPACPAGSTCAAPPTAPLAALATATCAHAALPEGPVKTEAATFRVTEVAGGLEEPWGLAFLPDGGMLVTEKPGRLRLVEGGRLREEPVGGVPEVYAQDQGGLLDITLDPDFASNRTLYLSYSHAEGPRTRPGSCAPATLPRVSPSRR